jgi:outer membrane biosynthesis protein TonB
MRAPGFPCCFRGNSGLHEIIMRIVKLLTVYCLAGLGTFSIQAQRTDEISQPGSPAGTMMVAMAPPQQTMPTPDAGKTLTPEQQAKVRDALRKAIEESKAATNAPATTATATPAPKPAPVPAAAPVPAVAPIPVPAAAPAAAAVTPAPAAGSKEARLLELEALYKGGQITATDYQARRAAIRAEK